MFSWKALSQTNFLFKHLYEYNGIAEQIAQYGPQNRNRTGFETTTKEERAIVFGEIVKSVNNDGLGLEKITYRSPNGEVIDTFLTQPEIDHLNDVAGLIASLNKASTYLTGCIVFMFVLSWVCKTRKILEIWRPFTLGKTFFSMTALLLSGLAAVFLIGPQKVFYRLHEWVFADMAQWHFYFQDSLMTTMLTEPLFGSIAVLLVITAFLAWFFLSILIQRVLS